MDVLSEKIRALTLSKTEKVIAEYILDHQNSIGLSTAADLAGEIGTSDTSIIRFVRRLGYSSYSEFKREMGKQLVQQYSETSWRSNKYIRTKSVLPEDVIGEVMDLAVSNLHKSCDNLQQQTIDMIADVLIKSKTKYIAGFRNSSTCAIYLRGRLTYVLPNVVYLGQVGSMALENIIDISKGDCLVLYSFPNYSEINATILQIAKERGATSILITDQVTSPLAASADIVLPASVAGLGFTSSYIAPLCLSEIIFFTVSRRTNISEDGRAERIDFYLEKHKLF